jgi:hypothetical protein
VEDEHDFLERLRAGDEEAFKALVARHDGALRRVARTFVRTPSAADDVVQETWLAVVGGLHDGERARFEAHLAECDGCAGYFEDMRLLIGSLRQLPEPPADAATRDVLLRAFRDLRPPA